MGRRALLCLSLVAPLGCAAAPAGGPPVASEIGPRFRPVDGAPVTTSVPVGAARGMHAHLADDLGLVEAVRFSPDGAHLIVAEKKRDATGCVGYWTTTLHVYDTASWRERLIVPIHSAVDRWGFEEAALVVEARWAGEQASRISVELERGESRGQQEPPRHALDRLEPAAINPSGQREARVEGRQVVVRDPRSGEVIARLGRASAVKAEARALDDASTVAVAALWPTGELSMFDLIAGTAVPLAPAPTNVGAFVIAGDGSLIVGRTNGELWRYRWNGRGLAGLVFARSGLTLSYLSVGDGRVVAGTKHGEWAFDLESGRLVSVNAPEPVGLLGGDPAAPSAPRERRVSVMTDCLGPRCAIAIGESTMELVAADEPGVLLVLDAGRFEVLGASEVPSILQCRSGALVQLVAACADELRGEDLAAARIRLESEQIAPRPIAL